MSSQASLTGLPIEMHYEIIANLDFGDRMRLKLVNPQFNAIIRSPVAIDKVNLGYSRSSTFADDFTEEEYEAIKRMSLARQANARRNVVRGVWVDYLKPTGTTVTDSAIIMYLDDENIRSLNKPGWNDAVNGFYVRMFPPVNLNEARRAVSLPAATLADLRAVWFPDVQVQRWLAGVRATRPPITVEGILAPKTIGWRNTVELADVDRQPAPGVQEFVQGNTCTMMFVEWMALHVRRRWVYPKRLYQV